MTIAAAIFIALILPQYLQKVKADKAANTQLKLEGCKTVIFLAMQDVGKILGLNCPHSPSNISSMGGLRISAWGENISYSFAKYDWVPIEIERAEQLLQAAINNRINQSPFPFCTVKVDSESFTSLLVDSITDCGSYATVRIVFTSPAYIRRKRTCGVEHQPPAPPFDDEF